ncbi:tape measure protein [Pseudomonas denitrificans (nom. rej.)]|uniref:Tape measure protein n=1 Tax=Pseudomonas denitrificans TaxID=43306 RepID=A0A9X7MVG1_PSEDE|nr:tape measure protein [Pseudomonas denitrificans (nom. rej.)]QEY70512.1 tape measure protein [Pseudomonas denitrificans (nom. rej.)]
MTEYARLVLAVDSTSARKATDDLSVLGAQSGKTEKATDALTNSFAGLGKVLAAVGAGVAIRAIIRASDQYGQMAARIRMASASTEEYNKVQDRLLQTANATYRPLNEAQEVYIRTADAIRTLGYNTDDALDITDSFSFLLVTNAASADKASSAIDAYSKAIQTGKIESDGWQSILAAMPTIVNDLAAATGRSTADIRKLGIEGKLSLAALNEALRQSRDSNEELAAAMETSVADATTALGNSFQVFVGKVNETSKASGILTENIGEMSEALQDPETIKAAQDLAAGVVSALNEIIKGVRETVSVVKWGAESISAALNGAASDDAVRLQDQLETYQSMLDNPLKRLRIGGKGQAFAYFNEEEIKQNIDLIQKQIDAFWKAQEERKPDLPEPVPEPKADSREKAKVEAEVAAAPSKAKRAAMSDEDRAAKQLASSYKNVEKSLAQQVALFGQSAEVARIKYDLENGELSKLNAQQKQHLLDLASELDAKQDLVDQDNVRLAILQETGQLQAANDMQFELDYAKKIAQYEAQGNVAALQRLETLKQIQDVARKSDVEKGTVEGVTKAPKVGGLDASVGGANSEMSRLEEEATELETWRKTELEKQKAFLDAKAINEETYATRVNSINQQGRDGQAKIEKAKNQALLDSSQQFFGEMATLSQSGNQRLGAIGKAAAIAQATVSGFLAIQNALAVPPFPVGVALAISAGVMTAANIASIAGVGFKTGGYTGDGGVNDVAGVVHGKEFVFDAAAVSRIGVDNLEAMRRGQSMDPTSPGQTFNQQRSTTVNINLNGANDSKGMRESTARMGRRVVSAVTKANRYA